MCGRPKGATRLAPPTTSWPARRHRTFPQRSHSQAPPPTPAPPTAARLSACPSSSLHTSCLSQSLASAAQLHPDRQPALSATVVLCRPRRPARLALRIHRSASSVRWCCCCTLPPPPARVISACTSQLLAYCAPRHPGSSSSALRSPRVTQSHHHHAPCALRLVCNSTFPPHPCTSIALARQRDTESPPDVPSPLPTWHAQCPAQQIVTAPTEARLTAFLSRLFKPP